jgi:DNA-directed RNA polymerase specialized sigma24 family protein
MLRGEVDDLVTKVVIRYSRVYGKIRRAGRELESFEAMLEDRVKLVYYEVLRQYRRHLTEIRVDAPDSPELPATPVRVDRAWEEEEERALLNKCLVKCLRELPEHARRVLIEYTDTETYPPGERAQMRLNLALREAGLSADRATPEEIFNARRNLNTAVSRWRTKHLQPCKEKCLRRAEASRRGAERTTEG